MLDFSEEDETKTTRLWRCTAPLEIEGGEELDPSKEVGGVLPAERKDIYESLVVLLPDNDTIMISRESKTTPRNYYLTKLSDESKSEVQVTDREHPQPDGAVVGGIASASALSLLSLISKRLEARPRILAIMNPIKGIMNVSNAFRSCEDPDGKVDLTSSKILFMILPHATELFAHNGFYCVSLVYLTSIVCARRRNPCLIQTGPPYRSSMLISRLRCITEPKLIRTAAVIVVVSRHSKWKSCSS